MGSRLHGNDGRRRRSHNRRRESTHHNRHSRDGGNPRGGAGDGFPSARERRAATGAPTTVGENPRTHNRHSRDGGNPRQPQSSFPRRRESTAGGRRWMGSRLHGNDGRRPAHPTTVGENPRTHNRHSREGGNPRQPQSSFPRRRESTAGGRRWMGSRLHGNDGRRRRTHNRRRESTAPQSSFPRQAGIHGSHNRPSREGGNPRGGGRRWVPVCTGTTGGGGRTHNRRRESTAPTTVIPAKAGIHGSHNRPSREGGNPRGGAGDGFPSPRERRAAAGAPTIVGENPRPHNRHSRDGGNPRGGRRWVPVCTGTTGGGGRTHNRRRESTAPQSSFPRRRESTVGAGDGFPSARERRAAAAYPQSSARIHGTHNRHSRDGGNPRGGPAMGSRLHGNDGRRPAHPQPSARIHGPTIVIPAKAGIHGSHNRHSRDGGNPRGGRRWVPVCTGTTGGGGRTHNRHSREWSYARVSLSGNDGARPCGSWSCTRAGRRPSPSCSRRRCCASGRWRSRPPARRRA